MISPPCFMIMAKKNPSYSEQRNFSMFAVQERRNAWSFIIRRHPIK